MNSLRLANKKQSGCCFPRHYRNVIKSSGESVKEIAKKLKISSRRMYHLMSDKTCSRMDNIEFRAIKNFVTESELKMGF